MDYGAFPPEFNSARMYAGAGAGPLLAAASAWDGLAAELSSAASAYSSVISGLVGGSWLGPGSVSMAAAAAPYAAWMSTTAVQAEQTANQARAAAGAYEAAFAMTVPPPVIAANRSLLASLVATNVLGQNTPAIAATEAHYAEMWAQDAAAMYGYAGASAAATKVTPFTAPQQNTNPAGLAAQSAAVAQSTGASAGTGVQSALSQMVTTTPTTLQALAAPAAAPALPFGLGPGDITNAASNLLSSSMTPMSLAGITQVGADIAVMHAASMGGLGIDGMGEIAPGIVPVMPGAGVAAITPLGVGGGGAVTAGIGRGTLVGALSVPQSWASAAPATTPATASLVSSWTAAPQAAAEEMSGMPGMPGMPMVGSTGRGFGFAAPRYGFRPTVMAHPPAAG
ncbi:PPE family protein [Mycobacterium sp. MFM001]|uniref:PPE family protein n=1 Tax=Mycobacterium sp. MFM001 TaxID=2049453 RepID=UPI000DA49551|nr:PPE family protein [Mycobacterium sp. MFM001]GBE67224.1 PPE family protein [Mycobacterium sp. MFM001]